MLTAEGALQLHASKYAVRLAFAQEIFVAVIEREGLTFHSRFFPPVLDEAQTASIICLAEGSWSADAPAVTLEAPSCFVFREDAAPLLASSRRAEGEPYRAIEIHVPRDRLVLPLSDDVLSISASEALRPYVSAVFAATNAMLPDATLALLDQLVSHGVVHQDVASQARHVDERFRELWEAFRPVVEAMYLSPTVKELSGSISMTPRDFDRELRAFIETIPAIGPSWRSLMRRWRVKLALLLLSAKGATVEDVARAAGYGSSTAMGRAFRDVGMLAPSEIQLHTQAAPAPMDVRSLSKSADMVSDSAVRQRV